jgi:hypothetical protein
LLPHIEHTVNVGALSFIFAAFLDAALDFEVLYLGVAIFLPLRELDDLLTLLEQ